MSALALPLLALLLVWLVYTITTHALPCLAGLAAARYAFETGLMRWLFAVVPHPAARIMLSIALVTPAILTSYFILENLSAGRVPSEPWRQALCTLGAAMFGLAAFGRLSGPESD
jgi:hypothetical protein